MENILTDLPDARAGEIVTPLLARGGVRIERIVSMGQATPADEPYQQAHDEWVLLLAGQARLHLDGGGEHLLAPGDQMLIPAGARHWVSWTAPDMPSVWLAVHIGRARPADWSES